MFRERLVHLDLKGAPPKPEYLRTVFPLMKRWGATGLCVEWEDTLPFDGRLRVVRARGAYSRRAVRDIRSAAADAGLDVMPLIQTFGHLEFVLKHDAFAEFREDPESARDLCPMHPGSAALARELVDQVLDLHPGARAIHLGGDEVWGLGAHPETQRYVAQHGKGEAYLHHMLPLVEHTRTRGVRVLIWDDMMRSWSVDELRRLAGKAEPVVWLYGADIGHLSDDVWRRYAEAGLALWGASAFKGACGPDAIWPDFQNRIRNHASWVQRGEKTALEGLILTGWSRYNHFAPLCELLPTGLPSLALSLAVLDRGRFDDAMRREVFETLGLGDMPFAHARTDDILAIPEGNFPGARAFRLLGKLQGARQLVVSANTEIQHHSPKRNGGRRHPGPARKALAYCQRAIGIAGEVEGELPDALRGILLPADVRELMSVQVRQLLAAARRARRELAWAEDEA
jgi:hexosaminidase